MCCLNAVVFRDRTAFEKKGLDEDIISLRFKHHQNRLIDILNRVLEERRKIKLEQMREEARMMNDQPHSAHVQGTKRSPGVSLDRSTFGKTGAMMLSPVHGAGT